MTLKFYTSVEKRVQTKSQKIFWANFCVSGIPCKGQPEAHYSEFSFKQYFPFQHKHLTSDLTKIHEKKFFSLMTKVWSLIFIMAVKALLNYEKDSKFELWIIYARHDIELLYIRFKEGITQGKKKIKKKS